MKRPDLTDMDLVDAVQVLLVVVAQEHRALTAPKAANALGLSPDEYMQLRRDATLMGMQLANRLRSASAA
jgi:hypothetical protein